MIQRIEVELLKRRIKEPRKFIQIVEGPRQVGKTTALKQLLEQIEMPYQHFSADAVATTSGSWISDCWTIVRTRMQMEHLSEILLVIDEVQKLTNWSEWVKKEWDDDTWNGVNIKVILLGSSRMRLERGLSESLMGRFEVVMMANWSFTEMRDAFDFSLDEYIYYGGYPGAAPLVHEPDRWREYVRHAIIDATINNDVLVDTPISKPMLLRQTLELSSSYSAQILSFTKMVGQLQDAGNTTTLSNYLNLLDQCGMVRGLQKYAADNARRRASVPKYQVYNNALMNIGCNYDFKSARLNPNVWGRIFESAIGAHVVNCSYKGDFNVYYWREGVNEVDFVLVRNADLIAIEVKSGSETSNRGLDSFEKLFHPKKRLLVGPNGFSPESFLSLDVKELF